jgi:hypothetical protein
MTPFPVMGHCQASNTHEFARESISQSHPFLSVTDGDDERHGANNEYKVHAHDVQSSI